AGLDLLSALAGNFGSGLVLTGSCIIGSSSIGKSIDGATGSGCLASRLDVRLDGVGLGGAFDCSASISLETPRRSGCTGSPRGFTVGTSSRPGPFCSSSTSEKSSTTFLPGGNLRPLTPTDGAASGWRLGGLVSASNGSAANDGSPSSGSASGMASGASEANLL